LEDHLFDKRGSLGRGGGRLRHELAPKARVACLGGMLSRPLGRESMAHRPRTPPNTWAFVGGGAQADMCRLLLSGLEMPPLRSTSANRALAVSGKLLSWMVRTAASTSYSARFSSTRWSSMTAYDALGSPSRGCATLPALMTDFLPSS